MRVHGIDFTSRPTSRKPITCLSCDVADGLLSVGELEELDFARRLIGRRSYKSDTRGKQTPALRAARVDILAALRDGRAAATHGVTMDITDARADELVDAPKADVLDALLCAVQAAWAWMRRDAGFGMPPDTDPLEGWIAEPALDDHHRS